MKKVCILTWHDISSAYSCLFYLKNELKDNYKVDIWGFSRSSQISERERPFYHSYTDTWYGRIKRFRVYMSKLHTLLIARNYDALVINDLDFFACGYIIKKLFPDKKVIHYNTEIHGADVRYAKHTVRFYEKHASYPDMIIECLKERAEYRKEEFRINQPIFVINNSLPQMLVEQARLVQVDVTKYFDFTEKNLPILVYAGGCNMSRSLGDILKCAPDFLHRVNFLLFCYGTEKDYQLVQEECSKHENCYLNHSIDRETLLKVMERCDIGVQYYNPNISVNHYLASPSKFFEYISVGLNVVSSNNKGIDRMINKYNLGVCFDNKEGIKVGIDKLLAKGLNDRENIKKVFEEVFCYEIDAAKALSQLMWVIG